ncbi:MAG: BON domain-containing protein [Magnetococcales bacterium]|nr:BON domain-containing protein [Magnetococcales bacterium]
MSDFKRAWITILPIGLLLLVSACTSVAIGTGAVATGMVAERRGAGEFVEDIWVAWKIRGSYIESDIVRVANINVSAYQGRVLLTGVAASQGEIDEAVSLAKNTRGVLEVSSEIKVQSETAKELANDLWISAQVKSRLFSSDHVRGIDIHVETTKGVVYLTGQAQSIVERDQAIESAKSVKGVVEVVSYIMVNNKAIPVYKKNSSTPKSDDQDPTAK